MDQFYPLMFAMCLIQGYSFCSGIYIESAVYEREYKLRYLLNAMGLSRYAYWLGNFLVDFLLFLMPATSFCITIKIM